MLCDDLVGWDGGDGREVHITDSLHCVAETNISLESNYSPIEIKQRINK